MVGRDRLFSVVPRGLWITWTSYLGINFNLGGGCGPQVAASMIPILEGLQRSVNEINTTWSDFDLNKLILDPTSTLCGPINISLHSSRCGPINITLDSCRYALLSNFFSFPFVFENFGDGVRSCVCLMHVSSTCIFMFSYFFAPSQMPYFIASGIFLGIWGA